MLAGVTAIELTIGHLVIKRQRTAALHKLRQLEAFPNRAPAGLVNNFENRIRCSLPLSSTPSRCVAAGSRTDWTQSLRLLLTRIRALARFEFLRPARRGPSMGQISGLK